jgi:hypothetical protein
MVTPLARAFRHPGEGRIDDAGEPIAFRESVHKAIALSTPGAAPAGSADGIGGVASGSATIDTTPRPDNISTLK